MEERAKKKGNPFYPVISVIVAAIVTVCAVYTIINYNIFLDARKKEIASAGASELIGSASNLKTMLSSIKNLAMVTAYDWNVIDYNSGAKEDYAARNTIMKTINGSKNANIHVHSICVVFKKHEVVLTSNEGSFSFERIYDPYLTDFASLEANAMSDSFIPKRSITTRSGDTLDVISYTKKIFSAQESEPVYVVVNISVDKIYKILDTKSWEHPEDIGIFDAEGNAVYVSPNSALTARTVEHAAALDSKSAWAIDESGGKRIMTVSWKSDYNGWVYFSAFEMPAEDASTGWIRDTAVLLLLIAACALGILLTLVFNKLYIPFVRLVKKLAIAQGLQSNGRLNLGYDYIENVMDTIIKENDAMRDTYLESIMTGARPFDESDVSEHKMDFANYRILLFSAIAEAAPSYYAIEMEKLEARKKIAAFFEKTVKAERVRFIMLPDLRLTAIFDRIGDEKWGQAVGRLERFMAKLSSPPVKWAVGISSLTAGPSGLREAFMEADEALKHRYFHSEDYCFHYDDVTKVKRSYYAADTVQTDMISRNLYSLNIQGAKTILDYIVKDIEQKSKSVCFYNVSHLFTQIFGMMAGALRSNGLSAEPLYSFSESVRLFEQKCESFEQEVQLMERIFRWLESYAEQKPGVIKKSLIEKTKEYVDKNFDKGISLSSVAYEFNMSVPYMSNLFKEKIGVSFVKYVTCLKIERAKRLLEENADMKISDISDALDMGNAQSFIRTFKKYEGITPGQYRERFREHL